MEKILNVFNTNRCENDHPTKYIFTQTNTNIINIINKNNPASIIRIGGCEYEGYIGNAIQPIMYEFAGYFDTELDSIQEMKNFNNIRDLYIESLKNSDMITVGNYTTLLRFGFVPDKHEDFPEIEKEFLINNIKKETPVCHWDMVNLDYEHNFFLNVFPLLNNKRVCIISSFTEDIKQQLTVKDMLFKNKCQNNRVGLVYKDFKYPNFQNVEYINVPLCFNTYKNRLNFKCPFKNSKELLNDLCVKISETNSDIYLIGAGMYANLLCDYVKKQGKIGINCGSSIQLFFGLLGNRFNYLVDQKVTNEYWKYPDLNKCIKYETVNDMGGYDTDGIQAYTEKTTK